MYKKHFEKVLALAMVFFCLLSLTGFPVRAEGDLKSPGDLMLEEVSNGIRVSWSSSGGGRCLCRVPQRQQRADAVKALRENI